LEEKFKKERRINGESLGKEYGNIEFSKSFGDFKMRLFVGIELPENINKFSRYK